MRFGRVVVTGGAGFIGSHLCDYFTEMGAEVLCVDNFSSGRMENLEISLSSGRLRVESVDVSESCDISGPVDAVLHLASPASPADYLSIPVETMRAGSLGTFRALDLARRKGARFLFASTSETYGNPQVHPQHEEYWGNTNPVGPRSVYDESKRFSEALTMAYRRTYGVDTAIIRIFNTFGPRMRQGDGRAIPSFITQALAGEPLTITGDGTQSRSFCYVDDLVSGIVRMLESDLAGPVNLGNPEELTIAEVATLIRELTGSTSPLIFVDRPEDDPDLRCPDISLARRLLGWEPSVSVEAGIKRAVDWFRETGSGAGKSPDQFVPAWVASKENLP
ncbi:UDP-glucuronic acid decarboxylase family protein [Streptomyces hainanensis]|uniref:SDR family oxidoreductase n=1 Tax=Streptomyces hainanensis TaxID=402648 RepID=A0A4R4TVJ5_9ACTN|nr:UDP-glucuronic acid decarboxylase family protein [Streptomyces hainanensis]TDC79223.1 SDR family oxidoreductase [Streptomyces hainanensis]